MIKFRNSTLGKSLLGVLLMLVIVACGGNRSSGVTECDAGFRLFEHEKLYRGPVCLPDEPIRVVTLATSVETMAALGVAPVGAQQRFLDDMARDYPAEAAVLVDTADIGNPPNIEAISALEPDLIIGTTREGGEIYRSLSEIAPTTLFDFANSSEWQETARFMAAALDRSDEMEALFDVYNGRIAEIQAELTSGGDLPTVSLVRVRPRRVQVYLTGSFPGTILQDVGLERPEHQQDDKFALELSLEELALIDADIVYIWTFGSDEAARQSSEDALAELRNDPLWQSLDSVKDGRVYDVSSYWIGHSILAANRIVEDVAESIGSD